MDGLFQVPDGHLGRMFGRELDRDSRSGRVLDSDGNHAARVSRAGGWRFVSPLNRTSQEVYTMRCLNIR